MVGTSPDAYSLERYMLRGYLWTFGFRWVTRLTGLVSTVILARLLTPADYGIVAIAMLIVGVVETFGNTGQHAAIVRHRSACVSAPSPLQLFRSPPPISRSRARHKWCKSLRYAQRSWAFKMWEL
jgi:hypothetical protein